MVHRNGMEDKVKAKPRVVFEKEYLPIFRNIGIEKIERRREWAIVYYKGCFVEESFIYAPGFDKCKDTKQKLYYHAEKVHKLRFSRVVESKIIHWYWVTWPIKRVKFYSLTESLKELCSKKEFDTEDDDIFIPSYSDSLK